MMRWRVAWVMAAVGIAGALGACEGAEREEPPLIERQLTLDPTNAPELAEWWSNGFQLLRLEEDGSYEAWASTNRFHPPAERGRWVRQNYAAVVLRPYDRRGAEPERAQLRRAGDTVVLLVRDLRPFVGLEGPPETLEDMLLGRWTGEGGVLELLESGRFEIRRDGTSGSPAAVTRVTGSWRVEGTKLVLEPTGTGRVQSPLEIETDPQKRLLDGAGEAIWTMSPG